MLLSIDPGPHTGVAVLHESGNVAEAYELSGTPTDIVSHIRRTSWFADHVVIEEGPTLQRNHAAYMGELDALLRQAFPEATWMRPSEWKDTPRGRRLCSDVESHHARDAVRMGREYLHKLLRSRH